MSLRGRRSFSSPVEHVDEDLAPLAPLRTVRSFDGTLTGSPIIDSDDLELRRDIGVPLDTNVEEEHGDDIVGDVEVAPAKPATIPSAYMVRQAQKEHIVGLSPIEELKIVQGEFQARAASKYPRLSMSSRLSSRFSTSSKRDSNAPRIKSRLHVPTFFGKKRIVPVRESERMPDIEISKITRTLQKDVENMTPQQALNFVNDAASTEHILRKQAVRSQTRALPWFMLHPTGKLRVRWDVATLVLLIYTCVYTPMQLAFTTSILQSIFFPIFDEAVNLFFCIDVILNFVTAFETKGILESRPRAIVSHYLKSWFLADAISSFPYDILSDNDILETATSSNQIFTLLKLLRVVRVRRVLRRLDYSILVRSTVSSLVKFFVLVMVTSHWFSCFFYGMSIGKPTGWVAKQNLINSSLYAQYVNSFYWSIMTMTTVGYGDVTGQNTNERLFGIFAMVNGAWIFAYGITNVVAMVSNLNSTDTQFQQKMDRINLYMEARELPLELRTEIREFFFNTRLSTDSKLRNETKILGELSALLRSKIALAINDSVLNKMPFFEGADHNFLMELALSMKMVCFPPNEDVIIEGEIGEEMFFIFRGAVEVLQSGRQIAVLGEQQYFGEMAILNKNCLRIATVATLCFCELRMLTREKFLLALNHYPSMRHRIAKFVHKRNQMAKLAKVNANTSNSDQSFEHKRSVSRLEHVVSVFIDKSQSFKSVAHAPDEDDLKSGLTKQSSTKMMPPKQSSLRNIIGTRKPSLRRLAADADGSSRSLMGSMSQKSICGAESSSHTLLDTAERDEMSTMKRISSLDITYREEQRIVSTAERAKRSMQKVTANQDALVTEITQLHHKFALAQKEHQHVKHQLAVYKAIYGELSLATQNTTVPGPPRTRRNSIVDNVEQSLRRNVQASSLPELAAHNKLIAQHTIQGVHFKDLGHRVSPAVVPILPQEPKKKLKPPIKRSKTTNELVDQELTLDEEFQKIMNDLLH
ncbi:Voltage-gated Ion Channel (VIC) Superfamily [Achlya hypogyna]|uniref:Voltage-gated Ion Channel (VIC) Superfamily n=1 Tax=Achlya hypogyna TaxID=1202772 RepID=A0A1V9ZN77_ACHHY|nr:Voltage-gated Ion Channel (VIC) Superfamily [Achlya hypogyna]